MKDKIEDPNNSPLPTVADLRRHLFATLDDLRNKEKPMDINRARAIANVAAQIVNSAKVENDYARLTGSKGSGFIPDTRPELPAPGKPGTIVHKIK